jgi:hypothetical protein
LTKLVLGIPVKPVIFAYGVCGESKFGSFETADQSATRGADDIISWVDAIGIHPSSRRHLREYKLSMIIRGGANFNSRLGVVRTTVAPEMMAP